MEWVLKVFVDSLGRLTDIAALITRARIDFKFSCGYHRETLNCSFSIIHRAYEATNTPKLKRFGEPFE